MAQARDSRGRFAGGDEAQTRNAGKYPIESHVGTQSVGTHVSATNRGLTTAARERQAILANVDARYGKRNVWHG
jgi:hypothetical protein